MSAKYHHKYLLYLVNVPEMHISSCRCGDGFPCLSGLQRVSTSLHLWSWTRVAFWWATSWPSVKRLNSYTHISLSAVSASCRSGWLTPTNAVTFNREGSMARGVMGKENVFFPLRTLGIVFQNDACIAVIADCKYSAFITLWPCLNSLKEGKWDSEPLCKSLTKTVGLR